MRLQASLHTLLTAASGMQTWGDTPLPERLRSIRTVDKPDDGVVVALMVLGAVVGAFIVVAIIVQQRRQKAALLKVQQVKQEAERRRKEALAREAEGGAPKYVLTDPSSPAPELEERPFEDLLQLAAGDSVWILSEDPGTTPLEGTFVQGFPDEIHVALNDSSLPGTVFEHTLIVRPEEDGSAVLHPVRLETAGIEGASLVVTARGDPSRTGHRIPPALSAKTSLTGTLVPAAPPEHPDPPGPARISVQELSMEALAGVTPANVDAGTEVIVRLPLSRGGDVLALRGQVERRSVVTGGALVQIVIDHRSTAATILLARQVHAGLSSTPASGTRHEPYQPVRTA